MSCQQAVYNAQYTAAQEAQFTECARRAPSVQFRPRVFIDGNQWCALYGDNIQDGVAGFGPSPEYAMADFDKNWAKPLPPKETP